MDFERRVVLMVTESRGPYRVGSVAKDNISLVGTSLPFASCNSTVARAPRAVLESPFQTHSSCLLLIPSVPLGRKEPPRALPYFPLGPQDDGPPRSGW